MREQLTALGCRIRDLRKQRNMTLQELGEKTHLTAGLLSKIENFRTVPSLPVLAEIARALGIALSGKSRTPGGGTDLAAMLGREETLKRLRAALELLG